MLLHKIKDNESRDEDGVPVYLTEEAIERLKEKLARLKRMLPDAAAEAQRTAAYGDRSDNAEYKQAKGALRRMHYQIFDIETQLKHAVVIARGRNASGTVQLGSTVVLEIHLADGGYVQKIYEIVGPFETDPPHGRISHESPLGTALIGHKERDLVEVKSERGTQEYRIIEVR